MLESKLKEKEREEGAVPLWRVRENRNAEEKVWFGKKGETPFPPDAREKEERC